MNHECPRDLCVYQAFFNWLAYSLSSCPCPVLVRVLHYRLIFVSALPILRPFFNYLALLIYPLISLLSMDEKCKKYSVFL
ncbi:hypothetical protein F4815DRAFT_476007 [Daldinia loculata]|nr:hypothetical protein F4815DRAFT_476007 [Daldinia loculata]